MTKTTTIRVSEATSERINEIKAKYGFKSANQIILVATELLLLKLEGEKIE